MLLKDVGHAELGAETYSSNLRYNGYPAIGVGVQQLSNANALDVDHATPRRRLAELAKSFPPGLEYVIPFDTTTVVGDSICEVLVTLGEAIVIVIVVIFLFLLDWRATIIPAVTIPVSLIGTFAFIKVFGFSINSLTLFGITLATGLVVDDAIVVIENVQRHIAAEHCDPHKATSEAMGEVTSAVIATSLVLIAVFVPVSFFPGTTGILYRQFSLTIAFAIAISAFNALTLSPALAALFLRGEEERPRQLDFLHIGSLSRPSPAFVHGATPSIGWHGLDLCKGDSFCAAAALRRSGSLLRRACGDSVHVSARSHRVYSPGRPGQPDRHCASPAGSLTGLYQRRRRQAAPPHSSRQNQMLYGSFAVMGFSLSGGSSSNFGIIFVPLKSLGSAPQQGPARCIRYSSRPFAETFHGVPGGLVVPLRAARRQRTWAHLAASSSSSRTWGATRSAISIEWPIRLWAPRARI